ASARAPGWRTKKRLTAVALSSRLLVLGVRRLRGWLAALGRGRGPGAFGLSRMLRLERDFPLVLVPAHQHPVALVDLVRQQGPGELGFELRADQAAQLAGPEFRAKPGIREVVDQGRIDLEIHTLAVRRAFHALELQIDD